jgi:hypothetical protein
MTLESPSTKQMSPSEPVHKPPRTPGFGLGNFMWRCKMWVWTTFAFSMLEPWEIILLRTLSSAVVRVVADFCLL